MTILKPAEEILIEELAIPISTMTILRDAGVLNVKQLCEMDDDEFWTIPHMNEEEHKKIEMAVEKKLTSLMDEVPIKKPTALHVAQYFISISEISSPRAVTMLKLQKLLYYAQGFHLAIHNEPLFEEDIIAMAHGPVVPSVYERLKRYGYFSLDPNRNYLIDEDTGELFDHPILKEYYKDYPVAKQLDTKDPFIQRVISLFKKS